jgi:pimeloyl-ACP methyl ester carboxylesterase
VGPTDTGQWALAQWRSTSPWAVAQAVAALGRHHSRPWLGRIDVPTAVVVTTQDHVIPPSRQRALAARIPGATMHEARCGHAGCVLQADAFVPALVEAVATVRARIIDRRAEREDAS